MDSDFCTQPFEPNFGVGGSSLSLDGVSSQSRELRELRCDLDLTPSRSSSLYFLRSLCNSESVKQMISENNLVHHNGDGVLVVLETSLYL